MRSLFLFFAFVLFSALRGTAQSASLFELGFGPGISIYQGDLTPNPIGAMNRPKFSFQMVANLAFHRFLSFRGNYLHTSLSDNEESYGKYHSLRNFAFKAAVNELSAQLLINLRGNNGDEQLGEISPYLFGGAGVGFTSIQRDWSKFNFEAYRQVLSQPWVIPGLGTDTTTALPTSVVTFPVGLGVRYFFGENVSLYAEASHRFIRSDYIDGFSRVARPSRNDGFSSLLVGLIFRFSESSVGGSRRGRGGYGCPVNIY